MLKDPLKYTAAFSVNPDGWLKQELPGLLPSQYTALRESTKMWINDAGQGAPSMMAWKLAEVIKGNPRLVAAAPSVADLVAAKAAEHEATNGEPAKAELKMSWGRELRELTPDQRLEMMPVASLVAATAPATAPGAKAPMSYNADDRNALVAAYAEHQGETLKTLLAEHGPGRLMAVARNWHDNKSKVVVDDRSGVVKQAAANTNGKQKADAWAATPEAAAMSPQARISTYRALLAE